MSITFHHESTLPKPYIVGVYTEVVFRFIGNTRQLRDARWIYTDDQPSEVVVAEQGKVVTPLLTEVMESRFVDRMILAKREEEAAKLFVGPLWTKDAEADYLNGVRYEEIRSRLTLIPVEELDEGSDFLDLEF